MRTDLELELGQKSPAYTNRNADLRISEAELHAAEQLLTTGDEANVVFQHRKLNRRAVAAMRHTLQALSESDSEVHRATLAGRVALERRILIEWWLEDLQVNGSLVALNDQRLVWENAPEADEEFHAEMAPWLELLERCGRDMLSILAGTLDPLTIFFGESSESTRRLYRDAMLARFANLQIANVVRVTAAHFEGRPLRVLEIGAGTGATAAVVLPILPAGSEYVFTDVSTHFLATARGELVRHNADLRFQTFDVSKSPQQQGIQGSFDLIIASNVLHVCRDLDVALGHVKELLKPYGSVLLCEVTKRQPWFDISFGLLLSQHGWTDADRPHPLLTLAQWSESASRSGLEIVQGYPSSPNASDALGQHVLVLQRPRLRPSAVRYAMERDLKLSAGYDEGVLPDYVRAVEWQAVSGRGDFTSFLGHWRFVLLGRTSDPFALELAVALMRDGAQVVMDARESDGFHEQQVTKPCQMVYIAGFEAAGSDTAAVTRSVLGFIEEVRRLADSGPVRAWFLSRGAWDDSVGIDGPFASLIWGYARAFAAEYPSLWGGILDVEIRGDMTVQAGCVRRWLTSEVDGASQARLRSEMIEIPRLRSMKLADAAGEPTRLRGDSSYLITGGWGALGQHALRYLCAEGARHVVIVGRHGPPPRVSWVGLPVDHPWRTRVDTILEVERQGASITWMICDVSNDHQVGNLANQLSATLPPITGVIHAAGGGKLMPLNRLSVDHALVEGAAKIEGTLALLRYFPNLEFLLLSSSLAAVVGAGGLGAYAAANAFMDSVAFHELGRHSGLPRVRSIQWGLLSVGGLLGDGAQRTILLERGYVSLNEADIHAGFGEALRSRHSSITVARMDWLRFASHVSKTGYAEPLVEAFAPGNGPATICIAATQKTESPPEGSRSMSIELILEVLRAALGDPTLGVDDDIFDRGADSLLCIEISVEIEDLTGFHLSPEDLFAAPTAVGLLGITRHRVQQRND